MRRGFVAVTLSLFAIVAMAEDLLVSPSKSEWLGWEKKNSKFKTCPGAYMDILEGYSVVDTQDRCVGPTFSVSGIMESVDVEASSFTFRDKGVRQTFFVTAKSSGPLLELPRETFVTMKADAATVTVTWEDPTKNSRSVKFHLADDKFE